MHALRITQRTILLRQAKWKNYHVGIEIKRFIKINQPKRRTGREIPQINLIPQVYHQTTRIRISSTNIERSKNTQPHCTQSHRKSSRIKTTTQRSTDLEIRI